MRRPIRSIWAARGDINLAHKMDIAVIAEGVEEVEQLKILQEQMCDILQGYFFSKPLLAQDFENLLAENCQRISISDTQQ